MGVPTNKFFTKFLPCLFLFVFLSSCEIFWSPHSPHGYVLPKPHRLFLDKKVNETSGLCSLPGDSALLTIADNKRKIYQITTKGDVSDYFGEDFAEQQEDFEEVVKVGETVYALVSNGTIMAIRKTDSGLHVTNYPFWSTEKNDFETLYYEPAAKGLIMVCKTCASEKGKGVRTAFRFSMD